MANSIISVRVDEDLKKEADILFNKLGINMSSAINIFLKQSVREQGIPFEMKVDREKEMEDFAKKYIDDNLSLFERLAK